MPFDPSGVIPVAGALGSAALQQHYALKNWHMANRYNAPKEQIKRLKEANLPLATMFGGSGGGTSSAPSTPNVDPTLGTAEGLRSTNLNRFQRKQMEMFDQQIREQTAKADIAEADRDFKLFHTIDGEKDIKDFVPQYGDSNLVQGYRRERAIKEAELQSKGIANKLGNINADIGEERVRAEVDNILRQIKIHDISIDQNENYSKMLDQVSTDVLKGGTGLEGLKRLVGTWFYKFLLR